MKARLLLCSLLLVGCWKPAPAPDPVPAPIPVPAPTVEPDKPIPPDPQKPPYTIIDSEDGTLHYHTGLRQKPKELAGLGDVYMQLNDCDNLPESFDLRTLGLVPPIRNQGSCGSCWSFSMTGSLESALLGVGKTLNLSEQELVSCDKDNWGCSGGLLNGFKYQINHGQSLETDFPYTARDSACKSGLVAAGKGVSFAYVGAPGRYPTEKELKCALYKNRTVPWITVSASNGWNSPPASENTVYNRCSNGQTNHAVGVVGWKKPEGTAKVPFIMKNSWGTEWGDKGYMSLPLGCDSFGEEVAFIAVEGVSPCVPPAIKLPALVSASAGVEILLGVKDNPQWSFEWFSGVVKIGSGSQIYVTPAVDTVYKLVASAPCGTAESSVKVIIFP